MPRIFHLFAMFLLLLSGCSSDEQTAPVGPDPELGIIDVPAEKPTIQAAIDAAESGQIVRVAAGTYSGDGNRDLVVQDKSITIKSVSGLEQTIIDCDGDEQDQHFGFEFAAGSTGSTLEGFTITEGYSVQGSAIRCVSSSPVIRECLFRDNFATISGGAIRCKSSSPVIEGCTFVGNASSTGSVLFLIANSAPVISNCIFAFNEGDITVSSSDVGSRPDINCCDVYGNVQGNWVGVLEGLEDTNDNFSLDPDFRDAGVGDYGLNLNSPCLPGNSGCGQVGALGAN